MATISRLGQSGNAGVGRPKNHGANRAILRAALDLYGADGYSGFNLTKVAAKAGVGKSSIYARWPDKERLLLDAFTENIVTPEPNGLTVGVVLTDWATSRVAMYVGPHAAAIRRVFVEGSTEDPVLSEIYSYVYRKPVVQLQAYLWDFKKRGIIPGHCSITRMVDAIEGSVLMRGFAIPEQNVACFLTEIPEYVEALVADQLAVLDREEPDFPFAAHG